MDVDTGFGPSAFNIARTIKWLIKAGAANWTAAGAIDRDDPLCQSYKDQYSSTHEIKLPDKLRAAEHSARAATDP